MKAVVIYDDFELVANATALLELVSPPADETEADPVSWNVKSYRLVLLKHGPVANAALSEAVDADLMVLAIHNTKSLPHWMAYWLECWAARRWVLDPAFVLLGGRRPSGFTTPAAREARRLASRHGLNCICDDEPSNDDEPAGFDDEPSVAMRRTHETRE